jgi:hypothetical protein
VSPLRLDKLMKKLIVLITLTFASLASAGDRYTFTNQFGGVTGYAQPNFNGGYTFTNQFGGVTGYAHPNFSGGYTFTNQFGAVTGYQH